MRMQGEEMIAADPRSVWDALNDPEVLRRCIPGCSALERVGENRFEATVGTVIGPIKALFRGQVELSDIDPCRSYLITFSGNAGPLGFAKGSATVRLDPETPAGTVLRYEAAASIGGKIAQLGARLIDTVAAKVAAEFFDGFRRAVAVEAPPAPTPAAPMPAAAPPGDGRAPAAPPTAARGRTGWLAGGAALALALGLATWLLARL